MASLTYDHRRKRSDYVVIDIGILFRNTLLCKSDHWLRLICGKSYVLSNVRSRSKSFGQRNTLKKLL